jgi:hypothetical protein
MPRTNSLYAAALSVLSTVTVFASAFILSNPNILA